LRYARSRLALDISDYKQKISGYLPKDDGMKKALTGADICIIPAGIPSELNKLARKLHRCFGLTTDQENLE
jgi:malate/lactate dehydrogenase